MPQLWKNRSFESSLSTSEEGQKRSSKADIRGREEATWQAVSSTGDDLAIDRLLLQPLLSSIRGANGQGLSVSSKNATATSEVMYLQSKSPVVDDDASIIRVSGFALHSTIKYRRDLLTLTDIVEMPTLVKN